MRLDDYCCLGRTVPEESKKYGWKVCSAGYSAELNSFVRVYPLPMINPLRQRSVSTLELERNTQDARQESWRLRREFDDGGIVDVQTQQRPTEHVLGWLESRVAPSIAYLNERRLSLGVIRPKAMKPYFRDRESGKTDDPSQLLLFEDLDVAFGADAIRSAPYLRFHDEAGGHDLQVREWGCYEWLRKEPEKPWQVWENSHLTDDEREVFLFVGNMCHRRNVWLIISMFTRKKVRGLFEELQP